MPRPNNRLYDLIGAEPKSAPESLEKAAERTIRFAESSRSLTAEQKAEKVAAVREALARLLDPEARRRYDRYGEAAFEPGFVEPETGAEPLLAKDKAWVPKNDEVHTGPVEEEEALDLDSVQVREEGDWLELEVPFRPACLGEPVQVPIDGVLHTLHLQPGTQDGDTVRIADRPARVFLLPDRVFHRHDFDLLLDVAIEFKHARNGIVLTVPTLEGQAKVKLPAGIKTGQKLRLRGKGVPHGEACGDLYVIVEVLEPGTGRVRSVGVGRGSP